MSRLPGWLTFRRYAGATVGMTLVLVSLGIYTAATGSGLACEAQWPLCSDRLVPALTINPDFVEWFHRAWAMVTGLLIVGFAAWSWRLDDRRTRYAATFAVLLLPAQVTVGAVTVTFGGRVPGGYAVGTHALHIVGALSIFTLLGLAALWGGGAPRRTRGVVGGALGGIFLAALLSRAVPLVTYSPGAQAGFYALALAAYLALLAVTVRSFERSDRAAAGGGTVAVGLLLVAMLLGRDLVRYDATWRTVQLVAIVGAAVATLGLAWLAERSERGGAGIRPVAGD